MCRGGGVSGWFLPSGRRPCFVGSLRGTRERGPRRALRNFPAVVFLGTWNAMDGWIGWGTLEHGTDLLFFFFHLFKLALLKIAIAAAQN